MEAYVDVLVNGHPLVSPDTGLDAVIDFVACAAAVPRLIAEVRRLRAQL